ncbi:MAG: hypothetical protein AVDCRST_MAG08-3228, partial [uncultured Acetobacteraceae bacterium]
AAAGEAVQRGGEREAVQAGRRRWARAGRQSG